MQITTIGLDIAKNVFQVHGIDANERVVVRKQLRRGQVMKFFAALPPCLVGWRPVQPRTTGRVS
jgi:transposase